MAIRVFDEATNQQIGVLSEDQLRFLQEHLELESEDDDDFYINRPTVDALAAAAAGADLIALLRSALGDRDEVDIRWVRDEDEGDWRGSTAD